MGSGCSRCAVGNPCTDATCPRYGSQQLYELLSQLRDKWDDFNASLANDQRNQKMLEELDQKLTEKNSITADGFKHFAKHVKDYFSTPPPTIDELENTEYRLLVCLDSRKEGEFLECHTYAEELQHLATAGRDPPPQCKGKSDPYKCAIEAIKRQAEGVDPNTGEQSATVKKKDQPFGSCYS